MTRKMIPAEESFARWRKDPAYRQAYEELEDEFSLAEAMIRVRVETGLTQEQLAKRMRTTQAVIARLESGRVKPSTRTLERSPKRPGRGSGSASNQRRHADGSARATIAESCARHDQTAADSGNAMEVVREGF